MSREESFSEYVYRLENIVDEMAIAFLSLGTITVILWTLLFATQDVGMLTFGDIIAPWIVMLALMLIARELWLLNRNLEQYMGGEK
jgi:hypothetical protein